jgi:hypothetical protein
MHGLETWQKILLNCGANRGSGLQYWWNLVEKVNAKKIDLTAIGTLNFVQCQGLAPFVPFFIDGGQSEDVLK